MTANYPPYVNAYGNIPKLFQAIKAASVPPKFTHDFMVTVLGLKSTSYRAMIPLLKRLGFLDQGNVPTAAYRKFRDDAVSGTVMADQIKSAYGDLYAANEYAHKLSKDEVSSKLKTLTGASVDDVVIPNVTGTFLNLARLANFDVSHTHPVAETEKTGSQRSQKIKSEQENSFVSRLGISYTINLNLPATTEIEVFNSIFKALKEHIINEV